MGNSRNLDLYDCFDSCKYEWEVPSSGWNLNPKPISSNGLSILHKSPFYLNSRFRFNRPDYSGVKTRISRGRNVRVFWGPKYQVQAVCLKSREVGVKGSFESSSCPDQPYLHPPPPAAPPPPRRFPATGLSWGPLDLLPLLSGHLLLQAAHRMDEGNFHTFGSRVLVILFLNVKLFSVLAWSRWCY